MAKVVTDYDHSVDFLRDKTDSWLKVQAPDSLWEECIRRAVNSELIAKGWTPAPVGDASLAPSSPRALSP